jgi:hypothetical protein
MTLLQPRPRRRLHRAWLGVALVAGTLAAAVLPGSVLAAGPRNDDLAGATLLTVGYSPVTKTGTTAGATVQPGEPTGVCADALHRTVWYKVTPAFTGAIRFDTVGSKVDASLSAFEGTGLDGLQERVCNAGMGGRDPVLARQARLTLPVRVGTTYRIRVDSLGPGGFTLHAEKLYQPSNDTQAVPVSLGQAPASTTASNSKATLVDGEPLAGSCDRMFATRWYSVTPSRDQVLQVDTLGSFLDTQLAVYRRTGPGQLKAVACSDDARGTTQSAATWVAAAGSTYLVQVGGKLGENGTIRLHLTAVSRPLNDDLADATAIVAGTAVSGSTLRATPQAGETATCDADEHLAASVWYRWDSGAAGGAMRLQAGAMHAAIATGSDLAGLTEAACGTGDVDFRAAAHTVYRIRIWGADGVNRAFSFKVVTR